MHAILNERELDFRFYELLEMEMVLSHAFRHSCIYIRKGIEKSEDFRGKRIGISVYQLAAKELFWPLRSNRTVSNNLG